MAAAEKSRAEQGIRSAASLDIALSGPVPYGSKLDSCIELGSAYSVNEFQR